MIAGKSLEKGKCFLGQFLFVGFGLFNPVKSYIGLLSVLFVGSDILAECFGITYDIEKIVPYLESDSDVISYLFKSFDLSLACTRRGRPSDLPA